MYHAFNNSFGGDSGRASRSSSAYASGRTSASASLYGISSQQTGLYPSPYQNRPRLPSKHGTRSYKRRANSSAGGDGVSVAFGSSAAMSTAAQARGRSEQDRFLVDINNRGQRNGATTTILRARKEPAEGSKSSTRENMWLPSSAQPGTRQGGGGRTGMESAHSIGGHATYGGAGASTTGIPSRRVGGAARGGNYEREGAERGGRINIPQRYTRSRERLERGSAPSSARSVGLARRFVRNRGHTAGADALNIAEKLPSIGGGNVAGGTAREGGEAAAGGCRALYPKTQLSGGKELVVRVEGCDTSGVCTIQGHKPGNPKWENQDNFVREEAFGGAGVRLFVVLDGHGEFGHLVSRRCAELYPKIMVERGWNAERATNRMGDELRASAVDCSSSGATCVLTTIRGDKITVANLGDSKCVLGRLVNGQLCAVPLSEDHKPDRPDERQRILAIGGQVGSRHLMVGSSPSGPIRIPMGPARVWYRCRGEIMGLAMSRSLGDDLAHESGVSSEPDITEHNVNLHDKFLIMATDGVWDVTEIGQAVQIVQGYASRCRGGSWDPQGAASLLAHSARKRWEGLSAVVDDITAMVIRLNFNSQ